MDIDCNWKLIIECGLIATQATFSRHASGHIFLEKYNSIIHSDALILPIEINGQNCCAQQLVKIEYGWKQHSTNLGKGYVKIHLGSSQKLDAVLSSNITSLGF